MAIVNNTLSEIGDVLIIDVQVPLVGVESLVGFVDDVLGVSGTRLFTKEFSYAIDGINFTDWITLSAPNLAAVPVDKKYIFDIKFRYTRAGTDRSGLLTVNSVNVTGTFNEVPCGVVFNQSVFSYFFTSCNATPILEWAVNVLEKIYKLGIVPSYIERGERANINNEDRDFIDFWTSVCCHFGLLVSYMRQFENFTGDPELVRKYLRNRDMIVCDNNELDDLTYLLNNFWDEMRQRGTIQIAKKKGEDINGTPKPVNGELLRLFCFDDNSCDEFLFSMSPMEKVGWNVGNWSPLYRGIADQDQLTKAYEVGETVQDLANYPIDDTNGTVSISSGAMVIFSVSSGNEAGISDPTVASKDLAIRVDPNIPYMLSFESAMTHLTDAPMSVRIQGYDIEDNQTILRDISLVSVPAVGGWVEEYLHPKINEWYANKFILYPHTQGYSDDPNVALPLMGVGQNIKMSPNTCYVVIEIVLDNTGGVGVSAALNLKNIKFRPLSTEYSTGFIGVSDFVQVWAKNRNASNDEDYIEDIIKRKLINYGSALKVNYI